MHKNPIIPLISAYRAMEHAKGYNVYNVGTGKNYSLNELTAKLNEKMGKDIKPKYVAELLPNASIMSSLTVFLSGATRLRSSSFIASLDVCKPFKGSPCQKR